MEKLKIEDKEFETLHIKTAKANILMIKSNKGFLACSYFDIATANRLNEPVAIVTGVKNYNDMLEAKIIKVSDAASELGVEEGMIGKDALLAMQK